MATGPLSDGELEHHLQRYRDWIDETWVEIHLSANSLRIPQDWELESWHSLHGQGLRGFGVEVAVIDHFAGADSHGVAVEALIRAIAPDAAVHRIALPGDDEGTTDIADVARAIQQAGEANPDIINLSFSHRVEWAHIHEHRDNCEAALGATTCLRRDPLCVMIAATGNAGLGVLGCPSLGRLVRRIGATVDASLSPEAVPMLLASGKVGTSFSAARVSGFAAVLASMYPGLSSRLLFDAIGVVSGYTDWPTLGGAVRLAPLVSFFRSSVSDDVVTDEQWKALARREVATRHALKRREPVPEVAAKLAAHQERAWVLVAGIEARRNGRADVSEEQHSSAIGWFKESVRLLERSGQEAEAAKSRVSLAGSMMHLPRQWTVMMGRGGATYLDPPFSQIDGLLQGALKTASNSKPPDPGLEAIALNSLCALYQQHNDEKELQQAREFGQKALELLGTNPKEEESVRAMLNLANALYMHALHGSKKTDAAWLQQLKRAEELALNCVNDKYEEMLKFSAKGKDLLAKIRALMPG